VWTCHCLCGVAERTRRAFLLPASMLKEKSVVEVIEAARQLKAVARHWRFMLAGAARNDNPSAIGWGMWDDMIPFFHVGMPKSLLEAAAAGCAALTIGVTGCSEAVEPGVTGNLFQTCDSSSLSKVLLSLIEDRQRQQLYGAKGQEWAKAIFSAVSLVSQTVNIYDGVLRHD